MRVVREQHWLLRFLFREVPEGCKLVDGVGEGTTFESRQRYELAILMVADDLHVPKTGSFLDYS